jgi:peptidoglycan hydrolase-like protein with peptidoglycan-binding domain
MKILRPALLVLLTFVLTGLGVPEGFGQTKATQKNPPKKNAATTSVRDNHRANSATGKKSSAKSSTNKLNKTSRKSSARTRKQPGQKAPTGDRISEIQTALARDGSYQGLPSGKWDDSTAAAMRKFQASHGLKPSGRVDAPSLQWLGLGSQTAGVAPPTPPPGATSRLTSSAAAPSAASGDSRRP